MNFLQVDCTYCENNFKLVLTNQSMSILFMRNISHNNFE